MVRVICWPSQACATMGRRSRSFEQALLGLYALEPTHRAPLDYAQVEVERLRYLLGNGHHEEAREALGRIASGAEDATLLNGGAVEAKARRLVARCTELRGYFKNHEGALIDYGQRYRAGKPISTSRAEGRSTTWSMPG